ncbi:hypothetical protein BKA62DRAFT_705007 [Auriculariales sp. MPI-PUGE-AT-0066]|nr:hypothetical protein BKA62DRAFT_705007 [Auriculariales sp. MPI-PUGE-AT-0066]
MRTLTRELLARVFQIVESDGTGMADLARCAQVCRTWRGVVHSQPALWTQLILDRATLPAQLDAQLLYSAGQLLRVRVAVDVAPVSTSAIAARTAVANDNGSALFATLANTAWDRVRSLELTTVIVAADALKLPSLTVTAPTPTERGVDHTSPAQTNTVEAPEPGSYFEPQRHALHWASLEDGRTWAALEHLALVQVDCPTVAKCRLAITAPRLRTLRLQNSVVNWSRMKFAESPGNEQLQILFVTNSTMDSVFGAILRNVGHSLRSLTLANSPRCTEDDLTPALSAFVSTDSDQRLFPQLQEFRLMWQPLKLSTVLRLLQHLPPQLCSLEITSFSSIRGSEPDVPQTGGGIALFNLRRCVLQLWTPEGPDERPCATLMSRLLPRHDGAYPWIQQVALGNAKIPSLQRAIGPHLRALSIVAFHRSQLELFDLFVALRACSGLQDLQLALPMQGVRARDLTQLPLPVPLKAFSSIRLHLMHGRNPSWLSPAHERDAVAEAWVVRAVLALAMQGHQPSSAFEIESGGFPQPLINHILGPPTLRPAEGDLMLTVHNESDEFIRVWVNNCVPPGAVPRYSRGFFLPAMDISCILNMNLGLMWRMRILSLDLRSCAAFLVAVGVTGYDMDDTSQSGAAGMGQEFDLPRLEVLNIDVEPVKDVTLVESSLDMLVTARGGVPLLCPCMRLICFRAAPAIPVVLPYPVLHPSLDAPPLPPPIANGGPLLTTTNGTHALPPVVALPHAPVAHLPAPAPIPHPHANLNAAPHGHVHGHAHPNPSGVIEPGIGGALYVNGKLQWLKIPLKKRTLDAFWECFATRVEGGIEVHASVLRFAVWFDSGATRTLPDPAAAKADLVRGAEEVEEDPQEDEQEDGNGGLLSGLGLGLAMEGAVDGDMDEGPAPPSPVPSPILLQPSPPSLPIIPGWRWHPNRIR